MAPANTDTDAATTSAAPLDEAKRLDLAAQTERQRCNDELAKATDRDPIFRNGLFDSMLVFQSARVTDKENQTREIVAPEIIAEIFACLSNCNSMAEIEQLQPYDLYARFSIMTLVHEDADNNITIEIDRGFFRVSDQGGDEYSVLTNYVPNVLRELF